MRVVGEGEQANRRYRNARHFFSIAYPRSQWVPDLVMEFPKKEFDRCSKIKIRLCNDNHSLLQRTVRATARRRGHKTSRKYERRVLRVCTFGRL